MTHTDINHAHQLYRDTGSLRKAADLIGSNRRALTRAFKLAGMPIFEKRKAVDMDSVLRLFHAGYGARGIAKELGFKREVIQYRLAELGLSREGSDACNARMALRTPEELKRLTLAANAASRGRKRPIEEGRRLAIAREKTLGIRMSPLEERFAEMLKAHGLGFIRQKAIGIYNADFLLDECPVVVEVFGGHWHGHGASARSFRQRFDYILDQGFIPVIVWIVDCVTIKAGAIEYLVALRDALKAGEPVRREEHVIDCSGKSCAIRKEHINYRPGVISAVGCDNIASAN